MARKKSRKSRKTRKAARRKSTKRTTRRKSARGRKGHIPLPILEKRAGRLVRLVHKRGGRVK